MSQEETKTYKTSSINNRRYLGNKYKLLPFIKGVVEAECREIHTVADIFAGTGAVSSAFADKVLITNDLMYSNYICNYAWFGAEPYEPRKIIDQVVRYNGKTNPGENYMTRNFADTSVKGIAPGSGTSGRILSGITKEAISTGESGPS